MPLWSHTSLLPEKNDLTRRILTTSSEIPQFSRQTQFPLVEKGITALPGICELIHKVYPRMAEKLNPLYKSEVPNSFMSKLKKNI